jgi:hypothetical protein
VTKNNTLGRCYYQFYFNAPKKIIESRTVLSGINSFTTNTQLYVSNFTLVFLLFLLCN